MEDEKYRHEHIFTMRDLEVAFAYRYDGGSFVTNHWHDSIEIIYIVDGSTDKMCIRDRYGGIDNDGKRI